MLDMLKQNSFSHVLPHKKHFKNQEIINLDTVNSSQPKLFACDTEDNSRGKTTLVNFFDGKNHYTFNHPTPAMEWLLLESKKYKKGIEVWFANLGYDVGNLFRDDQEFMTANLAGSRFITAGVYKEKIKMKDILNVIPGASVKKLGKIIGLEKKEVNGQFNDVEYCQIDTEIVYWSKVLFTYKFRNMGAEMKNTAAGTSFSMLINTFKELSFNNFTDDEHEFLKKGYYGGRTEVFNTSKLKNDIYGYDIKSSYPFSMTKIPIHNYFARKRTKKPNIDKNEGICECLVFAPEMDIPYLPLKFDNKLIFPTGTFKGAWTFFELRHAKKLGYEILEIYDAIEFFQQKELTLKDFVYPLFKSRAKATENNDAVMDYCIKILLNSSYGKFALGNEKTSLAPFEVFFKATGNFSSVRYPNNQIAIKKITNYNPATNFLIASLITAFSRHHLYDFLVLAKKSGTLIYTDTDSVFLKGDKIDIKSKKGELGSLDLQYEIEECHFVLPKTYYVKLKNGEEIYKCKGVWGDLAKDYFKKGYVSKMQPLKYIETCRKNLYIQTRNEKNKKGIKEQMIPFNMWVDKIKGQTSDYNKRNVLENGMTQALELYFNVETQQNEYKFKKPENKTKKRKKHGNKRNDSK